MKAYVTYTATVSKTIEVEIPDDTPEDERETEATNAAEEIFEHPGGLCWHCSQKFESPEIFEPTGVDF